MVPIHVQIDRVSGEAPYLVAASVPDTDRRVAVYGARTEKEAEQVADGLRSLVRRLPDLVPELAKP